MELVAEEPKNCTGKDCPGTIKRIYENNRKHYIKIFDDSPGRLSENYIAVTENDVKKITLNWEQNMRISVADLKGTVKNGILIPDKGYKLLRNIEVYSGNIDIII